MAATRWCVVPDLDDELTFALGQAEEALLGLDGWATGADPDGDPDGSDDPDGADDPGGPGEGVGPPEGWVSPLAGRVALEAVQRMAAAVRATQGSPQRSGQGPRQLGPDGRYEHAPLRFALLEQGDLDAVAGAAQLLGRHVVLRPHCELADGAAAAAERAGLSSGGDVVELLARLHGALDLAWTADADLLRTRIAGADTGAGDPGVAAAGDPDGGAVVFTVAEETAYQRLVDRFNGMWASGDPLARWTY